MALTDIQQLQQLVQEKKHILVTFRTHADGDAIASALALCLFLEKQGKRVDIVSDGFRLPHTLQFLPKSDSIQSTFSHLQKFIVTIDVHENGVKELSYDIQAEKLRIFITPKEGFLTQDKVRTAQSEFTYDLIITVDTPDLQSLGVLYSNNTDLFFKVPIINIDHHASNERFGQVHRIDITKSTTSEVMFDLLRKMNDPLIDPSIAGTLLTGIIAKTRSFKTDAMKPQTLAAASALIERGADREKIVHHLYRTRSLSTLKLWGDALTHMQFDTETGLVWSTITRDNMIRAGAGEHDVEDIVAELIGNSPEAKVILLFHEHTASSDTSRIHVLIHTERGHNAKMLGREFHAEGSDRAASFTLAGLSLKEAEQRVTAHIKQLLHTS